MATTMSQVIIVGGGPVGLAAAHSLHLAGIDFVVLERRDSVVADVGASLVLDPPSMRLMHQFGLLESLQAVGAELRHTKSFTKDGLEFKDSDAILHMKECFGTPPNIFHRADLLQIMYQGLPKEAKDKVLTGKRVIDILSDDSSVTVYCADGSTFEGSVVIGADGVGSKTRQMMRRNALQAQPEKGWREEHPYTSTYRCLWCSFPRPASSEVGLGTDTQNVDQSVMYLSGRQKAWIFLYQKLQEPTKERVTYTPVDIEAFAAQFADYPVTGHLKVKDVFNKETAGMSNLDEGIVEQWHSGRIVLTGDACHKFTPNAGFGLNNGLQDVAALCNRLCNIAQTGQHGGHFAVESLSRAFEDYQGTRQPNIQQDFAHSARVTRMHAWANFWYRVLSRYIMASSAVERLMLKYLAIEKLREKLVLDYVPCEETFRGTVDWLHPMKPTVDGTTGR